MNLPDKRIAYFSIEIALDLAMPTYSRGLGILASDALRAAVKRAPKRGTTRAAWDRRARFGWKTSRHGTSLCIRAMRAE
jgi:hypothetical protein